MTTWRRLWRVSHRTQRGITLLELMIVVVIVGILAAIAYPSYGRFVERAQVSDGTGALMVAAQAMERCYTSRSTYVGCTVPDSSPEEFYDLGVATGATTFLLTATGVNGRVTTGACSTLTLNHLGVRAPANGCW